MFFRIPLASAALALSLTALPSAQLGELPPKKGDRLLSLAVGAAQDGDYGAALGEALAVGAEVVPLTLYWDDIEVLPGLYAPPPSVVDALAFADAAERRFGLRVDLTIAVLDSNRARLPAFYQGLPFDHPAVVLGFAQLLDWLAGELPHADLAGLSIGHEVDTYLGADLVAWVRWIRFFAEVAPQARARFPGTPVGSKTTLRGSLGPAYTYVLWLNTLSDVLVATYYPLAADDTALPPSAVASDLALLTSTFFWKPIHLAGVGYPSAAASGSSPAQQALFVRELFDAWDRHRHQVGLVQLTRTTDLAPEVVDALVAYYDADTPEYRAFLASLGLSWWRGSGTPKPAWAALVEEAAARGW